MNEVTYQQHIKGRLWKIKITGTPTPNNPGVTAWDASVMIDEQLHYTTQLWGPSKHPLAPTSVLLHLIAETTDAAQDFIRAELIPPVNVAKLEMVVDCDASKLPTR